MAPPSPVSSLGGPIPGPKHGDPAIIDEAQLDKALHAGLYEDTPVEELCRHLGQLLKPTISKGAALDQLYMCCQFSTEAPKEYVTELRSLCKVAYPSDSEADCNDTALHFFVKIWEPAELRRPLLLQPTRDLQEVMS
ncbi:unnamed protein product [Dibothriocephalus latus]|uniref:Uncharacterized protein n=1 Tax=Dibothriocephalus latus TaxID=60516 RepID=A0A3P7QK51_DIBLA|nr:unnamed protein product [Dibothriocephalus latus]